ncbi:MAG TPA: glycosyltransferase family 39 protein [bacterium]|nr:glycosyltransferase family 39 protein [bacterium]
MPRERSDCTRRLAAVAVCLIIAYTAWQAWQVAEAPYPARYDYDEGVYAETAAAWTRASRPYTDVFLSQPPAFVAALRAAYRVGGQNMIAARAPVILGSTMWLASLFSILAAVGRPRAGLFAVCAAAGNAAFSVAAHTVQTDGPSEALAAAAMALAVVGARGGALVWIVAGIAWALAVLTKLTAVTVALPLILVGAVFRPPLSGADRSGPRRAIALCAAGIGAIATVGAFLPTLWTPAFPAEAIRYHVVAARIVGPAPAANLAAELAFLAGAWPLSAAAVAGAFTALADRRRRRARASESSAADWLSPVLLVWLAAEGAALGTVTPLWPHHLILLVSPLALLAGIGADAVLTRARALHRSVVVVAAAAVVAYVAAGAGTVSGSSAALRDASAALARAVPPGGEVVTDDPLVPFLAGRPVPGALIDTSIVRIQLGEVTERSLDDAIARPAVRAVVLWRGTFRGQLPGFVARAAALFPVVVATNGTRRVLVRRTDGRRASDASVAAARPTRPQARTIAAAR